MNLAVEQIAAPANGLEAVLMLSQFAPNLDETLHQRVIGHRNVRPDGIHQFLLADQAARVPDQITEHVEGAWPQPDFIGAADKQLTPHIQCHVEERVSRRDVVPARVGRVGRGVARGGHRTIRPRFVQISASVRAHVVTSSGVQTTTHLARWIMPPSEEDT